MSKKQIDLSRRKLIAGLGTAGVAAAGAGLGTTAYLNDTESFEDNVITAGTLDLVVDYASYWDQGMAGTGQVSGTADGDVVSAELTDVKPGDSGIVAFCPRIQSNPAYLWLCGELTANDENTVTEPEASADAEDNDETDEELSGEGELAQSIDVTVGYCNVDAAGDDFTPEDVETIADIWTGSLEEFLSMSQSGLPLDGESNAEGGFQAAGEQACFDGTGDEETDNPCICIDWEVPTDVGNEIQSDSLEFDIQFHAQQCRHNDGTDNPCCTELSLDLEEQYDQLLNTTLPDPYVIEITVEDENGDPFTGEITEADHGNDEFVWVTDHLGEFDETPENRYGAYIETDFDDDGTARISFGNNGDTDVSYLGLDVNEVTENIEINVDEVIDGLELANMCIVSGVQ